MASCRAARLKDPLLLPPGSDNLTTQYAGVRTSRRPSYAYGISDCRLSVSHCCIPLLFDTVWRDSNTRNDEQFTALQSAR